MKKKLDENEIYIIENALHFAEDKLKNIYQSEWLTSQIQSIQGKLSQQLSDLER